MKPRADGPRDPDPYATLYRRVFEGANDGFLLMTSRAFVAANRSAAALFGFSSPADLVGRSPASVSTPEQSSFGMSSESAAKTLIERALGGEPQRFFWDHVRVDGTIFPAEVTLTRLTGGGEAEGPDAALLLAIVRDMTEQREVERELRHSREMFQLFMDHMPAAVTIIDRQDRVLFHNVAARGFDDGAWIREGRLDLDAGFSTEVAREMRRDIERAFDGGPEEKRSVLPAGAGPPLHLVTLRFPFRTPEGEERLATVTRNVSAQVEAAQKFSQVFESAANAISVLDYESRTITETNETFRRLLGYTTEEMRSRGLATLDVPGYDPSEEQALVREIVDGQRERATVEKSLVTKDGRELEVRLNLSRFFFEGRPQVLAVMEDVTELLRLNEQLVQAQKMEAVGRLAGGVAHDFNNLLMVISGNVALVEELLAEAPIDREDIRALLADVQRASHTAAGVTRQLLLFSRASIPRKETVSLAEVVEQMQKLIGRLTPSNIVKEVVPGSAPCAVEVDPTHVQQVILNLAVNAVDAMPEGGYLTISTEPREIRGEPVCALCGTAVRGPHAVLCVQDTGTGIPAHVRDRMFDPFFTTKRAGEGTGLGLSTVANIVEQASGHLVLSSAEGHGTRFEVMFPSAADTEPPSARSVEATVATERVAGTVLLVEDNSLLLEVERRMLARAGMTVLPFTNPTSALLALKSGASSVDLVLSDYVMRGMNGLDLYRQVRELSPTLPFLLTSGYTGSTDIAERVLDLGLPFLAKPFSAAELIDTVRTLLERGRGT